MEPTPPGPSPKKRSKKAQPVEDLPLFAPRGMPPPRVRTPAGKTKHEGSAAATGKTPKPGSAQAGGSLRPRLQPVAWSSPATWLPVFALGMMIAGVCLLLQIDFADLSPAPASNRSIPTVVIDAGHGGRDSGATNNGLREKDLTLDTAFRLERHLRDAGFAVVLTRRDDRFLELFDRAEIANQIRRALFVSLHFNDNTTASGDGVETFYAQQKAAFSEDGWSFAGLFEGAAEGPPLDQGEAFARSVQASMVTRLGVTDRGAKPRQLAVVRLTRCPAVLVEGGFLNNPKEARKLADADYRESLAAAIAEGVASYVQEKLAQERTLDLAQR